MSYTIQQYPIEYKQDVSGNIPLNILLHANLHDQTLYGVYDFILSWPTAIEKVVVIHYE